MSKKALIVDDSMSIRFYIKDSLASLGFEFLEAESGEECFALLEKKPHIDLALLDWNLEDANGLDILIKLKEIPEYQDITSIFVTADSDQAAKIHVILSMNDSKNHYIAKPFAKEAILALVKEVMGL